MMSLRLSFLAFFFFFVELVEDLVGGTFPIPFGEEDNVYRMKICILIFLSFFVSQIIYILSIILITVPFIGLLLSQCSSSQYPLFLL